MVANAPGNANAKGVQSPPPPGQGRPMKAAAQALGQSEGGHQGVPRPASATQHSTEVLHQRKKMPLCPARAAVGGFAFVAAIAYLTLYSKKKPEATALDVAKVGSGNATPKDTHPRK